jgi:hypothetical protein
MNNREDPFIKAFLSAYEDGTWADANPVKPDEIDRIRPAVDQLAIRKSDGKSLAIEHTIIEPFVGDKEDFAFFEDAFLGIEKDKSLLVQDLGIEIYVSVGILRNQHDKVARNAIVQSVHCWIRLNRLKLPDGMSKHPCIITGIPDNQPFEITLTAKTVLLKHGPIDKRCKLLVRRQQVDNNLGQVIAEALSKRLPKLVNTVADKHILILERQHMNLYPLDMLNEIQKRESSFPDLASVDEIWILETIGYGTAFGGAYFRFELYENGHEIRSFNFSGGILIE